MRIMLSHNFPDIARKIETLGKNIAGKAIASALNKTVAQAKTAMSKEIRKEFVMPANAVGNSLEIIKDGARGGYSFAVTLKSRDMSRSLNAIHFLERYVSFAQAKKRKKAETLSRLFIQIKRGGGKKSLGAAFIGNKGRTVFIRTGEPKRIMSKGLSKGKLKEPIEAFSTIGVPSMFNTKRVNAVVMQMILTKFPEIFSHEAKFFTDKFNGK